MSSPPGTPRPKKRLRQLLTEPFKRSRSQSGSPSHSSQPLPQQGSGAFSSADAGSNQSPACITGTPLADITVTSAPGADPSHVPVTAALDVPIIVEPSDDGSGMTYPTVMQVTTSHNDPQADIPPNPTSVHPGSNLTGTPGSIIGIAEHRDTASNPGLSSPEPEHTSETAVIPANTVALTSHERHRNVAWNGPRKSLQVLKVFPPLGSAIESLLSCLDGLEVAVQNRHDFEDLAAELTVLSDSLKQHIGGSSSALLSDSVTSTV
ncbi:unnamed protein product, partial [Rhizoctonia solani]